jgi:hypothetical protein
LTRFRRHLPSSWPSPALGRQTIVRTARLILALIVLAACGGGEESAPLLSAPPTRTPQPPTATPSVEQEVANVTIVPLGGYVTDFLDAAADASALDRPQLFEDLVINRAPECTRATYYPDAQPLELVGLDFVSLDLDAWRYTVDTMPTDALIASIRATLTDAFALVPPIAPLTVCVMPSPLARVRGPQADAEPADGGLTVTTLGGGLLIVGCSGGEDCLPAVPRMVATAYHVAVQIGAEGLPYDQVPLLSFMLYTTRAAEFVHQIVPDALSDPWENALTPEQEAQEWTAMQPYLGATYSDRATSQKIERYLYGRDNSADYPLWGGLYIGSQIVWAYRASHPDATFAELATLPANLVLQNSGYAPGQN